jgi:hypothetical protein
MEKSLLQFSLFGFFLEKIIMYIKNSRRNHEKSGFSLADDGVGIRICLCPIDLRTTGWSELFKLWWRSGYGFQDRFQFWDDDAIRSASHVNIAAGIELHAKRGSN